VFAQSRTHNNKGLVRIDVSFGDRLEAFHVHIVLLTARSTFFEVVLTGKRMEAEKNIVRLLDDEMCVFATYINHLYTKQLAV
jgi:hypothetical protein